VKQYPWMLQEYSSLETTYHYQASAVPKILPDAQSGKMAMVPRVYRKLSRFAHFQRVMLWKQGLRMRGTMPSENDKTGVGKDSLPSKHFVPCYGAMIHPLHAWTLVAFLRITVVYWRDI
jgi:hypothetical protein